MEHQGKNGDDHELDDEEFPDDFQCCVCLEIMYKPVVLACGHVSCFGCVFHAMDDYQESHCPVCRHPYNHFPGVCELLHLLLLKSYPLAYKRRQRQVAEEEEKYGYISPQFDSDLVNSQVSEVLDDQDTCGGDHSLVQDSSKRPSPCEDKPSAINKEANLQCAVCKQLICRPVVLNCGHVYCETCICPRQSSICECSTCGSAHPNGVPNVCLVLDQFLENRFPEEYSARKLSLPKVSRASPSGSTPEKPEQAAKCSSLPRNAYSPWFSENYPNFHPMVGCDYCGMSPIIGMRYRCKDCVEEIGFDLCERCYSTPSKLPGRFNQRHTQEHQFEKLQPPGFGFSLGDEEDSGDYSMNDADVDTTELIGPRLPSLSDDASDRTNLRLSSSDDDV
ncbi:hypothetical protein ABFS83_14G034800 [Erythranthe nasuta]